MRRRRERGDGGREKETDRQTDRQTDKERYKVETEKIREKNRDKEIEKKIEADRQTDGQTHRQTYRLTESRSFYPCVKQLIRQSPRQEVAIEMTKRERGIWPWGT